MPIDDRPEPNSFEKKALAAAVIFVWAIVSAGFAAQRWPSQVAVKSEPRTVTCSVAGTPQTTTFSTNPYSEIIATMDLHLGGSKQAQRDAFDIMVCDLHGRTGVPVQVAFEHFNQLKEASAAPRFSPDTFVAEMNRLESTVANESDERRQVEQDEAIAFGIAAFVGPFVVLFTGRWAGRRVRKSGLFKDGVRARLLRWSPYAVAVASFWCFWQANARYSVDPFTDGQWRQIGWTLAAIAALVFWRGRTRGDVR